jgi:UDP-2,3-diacylglucosamine pyrophosphatase LpxH
VGCKTQDYKYSVGKDSFVVVGDGRFQILSGPTSYSLWDITKDDALIETIISYYDDGENKLYVRGNQEYVIVNYDNNTYDKYDENNLDKMPTKELENFQSDKMIKVPEKETFENNNGVIYIND